VLTQADVPFLLGGGIACWARGGPPTDHDVDFLVRPDDADAGLEALAEAGMETERPPEHWLYKAYDDGVLVDLIFEPSGLRVDDAMFERAEELEVRAVRMQVASLEDVVTTKLMALSEQDLDFRPVLEIARTLREQIDWESVRGRTDGSAYAKAFFTLVEELGIVDGAALSRAGRDR
jgi:predicted nucleotidyltransferase